MMLEIECNFGRDYQSQKSHPGISRKVQDHNFSWRLAKITFSIWTQNHMYCVGQTQNHIVF